ncbi:MAG: TonB-dependent receptor [Steroidobacteraceae bacterium]
MMRFFKSGTSATVSAVVATILAASAAHAQSQTADQGPAVDTGGLQEVVVTAQFRRENVQTTPLAITAVSAADIAARGETSITEIATNAPSVQLNQTSAAFGPSMSAFIRGIGQSDLDPALEPGVGIYIDDVYFGTLTGSIFDLLDLDRVEVLRGPQGTLNGMNSEGGAVKLYSKKPDATESMSFDVLGGSRNHIELRAGTNFAITDNLFMRLSAVGNQQDGYVTRYNFQCANPSFTATDINGVQGTYSTLPQFPNQTANCVLGKEGGTGYVAGRMALRWLASDNLEMNLIGDVSNTNQDHPAETLGYAGPGPLVGNASALTASSAAVAVPTTNGHLLPYNELLVPAILPKNFYASYANFCAPAPSVTGNLGPPFGGNENQQAYCVDPRQTIHNWGVSLSTDWTLGGGLSFKNIASFRGYSSTWVHDNSVSIWPLDLGAEGIGHHQFSEEARLSGSYNNFVDWTAGLFYFSENSVYFGHEDLSYALLFAGLPGPELPNLLNFYQNDPIDAHDKAAFLHTTFHLTPKLDAILGTRYTAQDKTYHYVRLAPDGTVGGESNTDTAPVNGLSSHYNADRWDFRGNLNYHFNDAIMTYAQYSTGFKGGGVDPRPFYPVQAQPFKPESLSTFELGIKTSWFDNHLHANLDAYFSQYRNIQLSLANCAGVPAVAAASAAAGFNFGSPCIMPYNAGDAHQKGIEFDSQARFGGLQVDANISWLNFHYTDVNPASGVTPNEVTPYTPTWTANAGVQYTVPFAARGSVTARLDGNTISSIYTNAQNTFYNRTGGYTLYNAHLTWESAKSNWQGIIQLKNLTGKRYYFAQFDLVADQQGTQVDNPGPPLEIDLEIKHKM